MDPDVPLVVPEVNPTDIAKHRGIIANPNCSTIQMVVALKPLHDAARILRVIVSTYQSVSGAGQTGIHELAAQTEAHVRKAHPPAPSKFAHPILGNCIPQIDDFLPNGYTKEEMKLVNETRKIMGDETIDVCPTCVRVPVLYSHSESILVETERPITPEEARELWSKAPGVTVVDDPASKLYPLPLAAFDRDDVFVGRIRRDLHRPNALLFWCVSDNLRKGAATNAVQIAEELLKLDLVRAGSL
jgi:aspartate-semialdehyde dehydrogenase